MAWRACRPSRHARFAFTQRVFITLAKAWPLLNSSCQHQEKPGIPGITVLNICLCLILSFSFKPIVSSCLDCVRLLRLAPDAFTVAPMSSDQFTRLDWRPSTRRASYPRVRAHGGRKTAPAALLAYCAPPGVFAPGAPRCAHCKRVAMRDLPVCRQHGGARWTARLRPYVSRGTPKRGSDAP